MSLHGEVKAFNSFSAMGKAADNHFIDAKTKVKYRAQNRFCVGITELLEA